MIQFIEIKPQYAVIKFNSQTIGYLYKDYNSYTVEVGYMKHEFKLKEKHLIKDFVLKMYVQQKIRFKRTLQKEHKLRNSIYNTGQSYEVR